MTTSWTKRSLTMAELDAQERLDDSNLGLLKSQRRRRSSRQTNRIATSQLRRLKHLFWNGDSLYSCDHQDSKQDVDGDRDQEVLSSSNHRRRSTRIRQNTLTSGSKKNKAMLTTTTTRCTSNNDSNNNSTSPPSPLVSLATLSLGGRLRLSKIHDSPHIYIIDDFLTPAELAFCQDQIANKKASHFQNSFVDDPDTKTSATTTTTNIESSSSPQPQRTSTFLSFGKLETAVVAGIERRAAELCGVTVAQIEPLQLVRYRVGQYFGVHHDLGILYDDGSVQLPPKQPWCKRRLVTIFVYLNTLMDDTNCGGCTYFSQLNLRVPPKQGRAVVFCNITKVGMPDERTVHAGETVVWNNNKGDNHIANINKQEPVKYGINVWACEE